MKRTYTALLLCAAILMIAGCGGAKRVVTELDSASHHVSNGYKFLDRGMVEEAEREFRAASDIKQDYSPAYAGLAVVRAEQGHYDLASHLIRQASTYATDPAMQADVEVANMRLLTAEKAKGWIESVMTSFNRATELNPHLMSPYFFMGQAFKESYNFKNAEEMYLKAAGSTNSYQVRAIKEGRLMRDILKYAPQSMAAKRAALANHITRAELAALLVQEFDIVQLIPPETGSARTKGAPEDIADRPYSKNIETVLTLGLPVLQTEPDKKFHPNEPIKRGEIALITQDIIVRATGRKDLATFYAGRYTPFSDLRSNSLYFNAAMLNVSLEIMNADSHDRKEFDPLGAVSGADALRILHRTMEEIEHLKTEKLHNT